MATTGSETFSRFGGLWTDRADAPADLDRRVAAGSLTPEQGERLAFWMAHGYVVLPGAVEPDVCDVLSDEIARMWREGADDVLMQPPGQHEGTPIVPGTSPVQNRVVDVHAVRASALPVLLARPIVEFLGLIFERDPLLFQSLTFERGSEQSIHQDTAYVVVHPPLELAAAWIALQDVVPGSGELQYYDGSHRLPEYLFSGEHKHWSPVRDGDEQHGEWLASLHTKSADLGLELLSFLPRKGDVFVWAADLAHGGAPVQDRSLTRRSIVGHYCPIDVDPNYFTYREDRRTVVDGAAGHYSSEYYDLSAMPPPR